MRVWRITTRAHASFDGEGARLYGSRWTPRGMPAVFTSATLSLAALERFVHTDADLESPSLVAISADVPAEEIAIDSVDVAQLQPDWRTFPPSPVLTAVGKRWLQASETAVLSVPSAVIPHERNFLLNPRHREFARIAVSRQEPFTFDPRMWKK